MDFWTRPLPYWKTAFAAVPFSAATIFLYWGRLIRCGIIQHLGTLPMYTYTHIPLVDQFFSYQINFLKLALSPGIPPFLSGFISSLTTVAYIPLIEASRKHPKMPLSLNQFFVGVATQTLGRGVAFPWWYSVFAASPSCSRRDPRDAIGQGISQYDAEANLVSIVAGYILPSMLMAQTRSESWILTWLLYPFTWAVLPPVYKFLRTRLFGEPEDKRVSYEMGHRITILTYCIGFVYAAWLHISVCAPIMFDMKAMKNLLMPRLTFPSPSSIAKDPLGIQKTILEAVRWDAWLTFFATFGATLAFARSKKEALILLVWAEVGMAIFGSGGVLNAVWIWREIRLKEDENSQEIQHLTGRAYNQNTFT